MLAFIGLVALVLVIAGAGEIVLTHNAARNLARQQLVNEATSLTSGADRTERAAALKVVRRVLRLEDARLVRVSVEGLVISPPPAGLTTVDLDPTALLNGRTVSGQDGDLVFAAAPVPLAPATRIRLKVGGAIAIVLTQQVSDEGPSWAYFLLSGAGALLIAALVAWSLSRRMTRPLVDAAQATARIAAGDLQTRVPERPGDFTESVLLARSINEMAQGLQDAQGRERHLLLSVSHDLRTPLTSIRGFAEAITDGAVDDNSQAAAIIIAESRRLERLVGDLLELGKLEARQLSMTMRPTDVAEVVETTAEGFRPLARRADRMLAVHLPAGGPYVVMADPDRLAQIMANLVENALTFARTTVTVSLAAVPDRAPPHFVISVEDDGPGIGAADLPRVFDRFYQADHGPNRQFGSGLGLAIVAELARAMGAGVQAESPVTPFGGSRFTVSLSASASGAPPGGPRSG